MSDRKQRILREACRIISTDGYAALTMRAVARASGLKLGALQYHYPTWDALLLALTAFIAAQFRASFETLHGDRPLDLQALIVFEFADPAAKAIDAHRLFPQLWAMALVEPMVKELVDGWYEEYLCYLEDLLRTHGAKAPRGDALLLMAMLEGSTLFVGEGARWESERPVLLESILEFVRVRYAGAA